MKRSWKIFCDGAGPDDVFVADDCGCVYKMTDDDWKYGERVWGCDGCGVMVNALVTATYQCAEYPAIRWQ